MKLTIGSMQKTLKARITAGIGTPVLILGAPGVGKTAITTRLARDLLFGYEYLSLMMKAPFDLTGVPHVEDGYTEYAPPSLFRRLSSRRTLLHLDELTNAVPAMQALAQSMIHERRVGDAQVPDDTVIIACANTREHGAAVYDMPAPLVNRFDVFTIDHDSRNAKQEFLTYASGAGFSPDIVAFLQLQPDLIHRMPSDLTLSTAWPSPRSWENASKNHIAGLSTEPSVGVLVSAPFDKFCRVIKTLPDINLILAGTPGVIFPADPEFAWAYVAAMSMHVKTPAQAVAAATWIGADRREFAAIFMTMVSRTMTGQDHKQLRTLVASNPDSVRVMAATAPLVV